MKKRIYFYHLEFSVDSLIFIILMTGNMFEVIGNYSDQGGTIKPKMTFRFIPRSNFVVSFNFHGEEFP